MVKSNQSCPSSAVPTLLEPLEGRRLLAVIAVDSLLDTVDPNDNVTTFREAVADAAAGDTIDLTGLAGTITLGSTIDLDKDLTLTGPGADQLAITGGGALSMIVQTAGDVTASGFTLRDSGASGWFISSGDTTLRQLVITGSDEAGVVAGPSGGALELDGVSLIGNGVSGLSLFGSASATVANSTFANNTTDNITFKGGGITARGDVDLTLVNNTITANDGGGVQLGYRDDVFTGELSMTNNLIVGNTNGPGFEIVARDQGSQVSSLAAIGGAGHNVLGTLLHFVNDMTGHPSVAAAGGPLMTDGVDGNQLGATTADVKFHDLGLYGGSLPVIPLQPGSVAIDVGHASASPTDQRGSLRNNAPDAGAFEFAPRTLVVDSLLDTVDATDNETTFREAVANAAPGDTIDATGLNGTIEVEQPFRFSSDLTVLGPGADQLTIDGNGVATRLLLHLAGDFAVSGLTLTGTNQGLISIAGSATLTGVAVIGNDSAGIMIQGTAVVTVVDSLLADNTSAGIDASGTSTLHLRNSTLINNAVDTVSLGAGVTASGSADVTLTNNTITANRGGGVQVGNHVDPFQGSLSMTNNLVVGNTFGDDVEVVGADQGGNVSNITAIGGDGHNLIGTHGQYIANGDVFNTNMADAAGGALLIDGVDGNQVGVTLADAKLGTLGDHGGATQTVPLLVGSPAINAAHSSASATDQRGQSRQGVPDIGAFEYVTPNVLPTFGTTALPVVTVGQKYKTQIVATDADLGDTLSLVGQNLPDWLTLEDHGDGTATLVGTPPHRGDAQSIQLRVSDGRATVDTTMSLAFRLPIAEVVDDVLYVLGRPFAEDISVLEHRGQVRVTRGNEQRDFDPTSFSGIRISGMGGGDTIRAEVGQQPVTVIAGTGDDDIVTGAGDDRIYAGDGADTIDVGNGANHVFAGAGNDTVMAGDGDDVLRGAAGDDELHAGGGTNELRGHDGHDTLTALTGRGKFWGGAGHDTMTGGNSADWFAGHDGNDHIFARGGRDVLHGGDGTDTADRDDRDVLTGIEQFS
jgi:hypothetical protein